MVTLDDAIIAKIVRNGKHFEILVDADIAYDLKEGRTVSISRMLAVNEVFTEAKKANRGIMKNIGLSIREGMLKIGKNAVAGLMVALAE